MNYAVPEDVSKRLGRPLTDPERELAAVLLGDAETMIRARLPDLDTRVATGRIARNLVVMIEANAVARVLRNPSGYTSETAGDYSYTLDVRAAAGYLTIPDTDWRDLGVNPRGGAFTIRPALASPPEPDRWG
ncbi:Gp19/Gp15/Gp42 family protein [Actinokineospora enzanensis]|uniref:Gp19/Gp15/Gp42 family protein n=1 Tax=Actinokineospora enzanensis TaxID=155975 RepID=UPI00037A07D5|nr:Gp19/Gp15/Gp42 family protein [Actinokineospora enzanensis]